MTTKLFRSGNEFRLQTEDSDIVRQAKRWAFAEETSRGVNFYFYVFRIPANKAKWIADKLSLDDPRAKRSPKQRTQSGLLVGHGSTKQFVNTRSRLRISTLPNHVAATVESRATL